MRTWTRSPPCWMPPWVQPPARRPAPPSARRGRCRSGTPARSRCAGGAGPAAAAPLAWAVALSIGDAGVERVRVVRGTVRRVPDLGPAIDESTAFDLASLTKPMATVALAMVLAGDGALDLDAPVRRWLPEAQT